MNINITQEIKEGFFRISKMIIAKNFKKGSEYKIKYEKMAKDS